MLVMEALLACEVLVSESLLVVPEGGQVVIVDVASNVIPIVAPWTMVQALMRPESTTTVAGEGMLLHLRPLCHGLKEVEARLSLQRWRRMLRPWSLVIGSRFAGRCFETSPRCQRGGGI